MEGLFDTDLMRILLGSIPHPAHSLDRYCTWSPSLPLGNGSLPSVWTALQGWL